MLGCPWHPAHAFVATHMCCLCRQKQARAAAGGAKHRGDDDDPYDEEEMFLRLDDVLEGGHRRNYSAILVAS